MSASEAERLAADPRWARIKLIAPGEHDAAILGLTGG